MARKVRIVEIYFVSSTTSAFRIRTSELYLQAQHHPFSSSKANRSIAPVGVIDANPHMAAMTVPVEIHGGAKRGIREVLWDAFLLSDAVATGCVDGELEKLRAGERRPNLDPRP